MRDTVSLAGRRVLVTGAASGIGRSVALRLHRREHASVIAVDRDAEGLASLRDEAGGDADSPPLVTHVVDLAAPAEILAFATVLGDEPIDALVNNAGVFYAGSFETMALADFERVLAVNLLAAVRLTHALLPRLVRSPLAVVVNVGSLAGLIGAPGMCAYSASKFALVGFSEALAAELAGRVAVSAVCPTFVQTNIASASIMAGAVAPEDREKWTQAMNGVLSRVGSRPDKVAAAIIGAIKRPRRLVLVNPDAHVLFHLKRLLPTVSGSVVAGAYRQLLKRGIVRP